MRIKLVSLFLTSCILVSFTGKQEIPLTDKNIITMDTITVSVSPKEISMRLFMELIAEIESDGDYYVVNRYGMMGRYQFSHRTVRYLGYDVSRDEFLYNPRLQDEVMRAYMLYNERSLNHLIEMFDGVTINGVKITRAGILAGAHFAGTTGMKQYLLSYGENTTTDANHMNIDNYIKHFSDFKLPQLSEEV